MKKIKPCTVKLIRYNTEKIRDIIGETRVRKCQVLLRRFDLPNLKDASNCVYGQSKVRPCCVRLPKLNLEVFDALEDSSSEIDVEIEAGRQNANV